MVVRRWLWLLEVVLVAEGGGETMVAVLVTEGGLPLVGWVSSDMEFP